MSEKRKIQRFNLDEGRIWEAIEGLSPFKTTYTLEEVCEKLNELDAENRLLKLNASKFERKYIETLLENTDLKTENKRKTNLIQHLERKVKSQKRKLREMQK